MRFRFCKTARIGSPPFAPPPFPLLACAYPLSRPNCVMCRWSVRGWAPPRLPTPRDPGPCVGWVVACDVLLFVVLLGLPGLLTTTRIVPPDPAGATCHGEEQDQELGGVGELPAPRVRGRSCQDCATTGGGGGVTWHRSRGSRFQSVRGRRPHALPLPGAACFVWLTPWVVGWGVGPVGEHGGWVGCRRPGMGVGDCCPSFPPCPVCAGLPLAALVLVPVQAPALVVVLVGVEAASTARTARS